MPDEKSCKYCSALVPADSLFYEACGRSLEEGVEEPQPTPYQPPEVQLYVPPAYVGPSPEGQRVRMGWLKRLKKWQLIAGVAGIAVVLIIAAFVLMSSLAAPSLSATYESPTGFSIKYPSDWAKNEPQSGSVFVTFAVPTKNSAENLNVLVNASGNKNLINVTNAMIAEVHRNYPDFTLIEGGNTKLGGYPAYGIVYTTFTNTGGQQKIMQIWTIKDGYLYALTYKATPSTYDKYIGTALQMVDSFQFTQRSLSFEAGPTRVSETLVSLQV